MYFANWAFKNDGTRLDLGIAHLRFQFSENGATDKSILAVVGERIQCDLECKVSASVREGLILKRKNGSIDLAAQILSAVRLADLMHRRSRIAPATL